MLNKINIAGIIIGHLNTLVDARSGKRSIKDITLFYVSPVIAACLYWWAGQVMKPEMTDTLVTAGAIFTGLLLSLLVLVYDQRSKLKECHDDTSVSIKTGLQELFYNISYATVISVALVFMSFMHKMVYVESGGIGELTGPILIFLGVNFLLTILMILKRINIILTMD